MLMIEYKGYYFKATCEEGNIFMSGLPLPPLTKEEGQKFIDCEFHPRLWETLEQIYVPAGVKFENCNFP
jgi:hypothetical protein